MLKPEYIAELRRRAKESRAYHPYQLIGLEIADMLSDRKHKALYIKMAKEGDARALRDLAKSIAAKHNVKNKGAYFMKVWSGRGK